MDVSVDIKEKWSTKRMPPWMSDEPPNSSHHQSHNSATHLRHYLFNYFWSLGTNFHDYILTSRPWFLYRSWDSHVSHRMTDDRAPAELETDKHVFFVFETVLELKKRKKRIAVLSTSIKQTIKLEIKNTKRVYLEYIWQWKTTCSLTLLLLN